MISKGGKRVLSFLYVWLTILWKTVTVLGLLSLLSCKVSRVVLEHLKHAHDASECVLDLSKVLENWQLLAPQYTSRPLRSLCHFSQAYLISHSLSFLNGKKNALNFRYSLVLSKNSLASFHRCMQTRTHSKVSIPIDVKWASW